VGIRLVLDTSVMAAALRSDRGASRRLLVGALSGRFTLLVSVPLMVEYQSVLARPEHLEAARVSAGDVDGILSALAAVIEPVRLAYLWRPLLRDPADEMALETAANGGADLLCTLNIRDFEPAKRLGMSVLSPGEAWRRVEEFHEKK
jgi:putative PIN family toxin of toxin-antitoxin system